MHPLLFHVGTVTIYSFGLLLAVSIVAGSLTVALLARRARLPQRGMFDNILFIVFAGVIGARVAYVIAYPHFFMPPEGRLIAALALWQGGLLFYGAVIGAMVAAWFSQRREATLWRWLDVVMLGSLLGVGIGQIGCLLGGCAEGIASSTKLTLDGHIPVQLFESGWAFALFAAGMYMYLTRPAWRRGGYMFLAGGLLFFAGRLIIDIWRISTLSYKGVSLLLVMDIVMVLALTLIVKARAKQIRGFPSLDERS